jgi:pimeloyl-ACP methyl ester carboxylesterase
VLKTMLLAATLLRTDHFVDGERGIRLFVREVRAAEAPARTPILLLHGARVPGIASFDLPVPGGSLAADLAAAGHPTFVMDLRGYGRSTRPPEMSRPPEAHPPLVRSVEAVRDVDAVVAWIVQRTGSPRVDLVGWATGGHWLGFYATLHPERVGHLVLLNSLYGGTDGHPMLGRGSDLEDKENPGRPTKSLGAYRWSTGASLLSAWDRSIPLEDKSAWRDPAVADAYVAAALDSDPEGKGREPRAFRAPSGAMEDSFYLATGRSLWDASLVLAPTLVLASERDFWSRPADREKLRADLVHAPRVSVVVIPGATHHVHLDRPERGRKLLLDTVLTFLSEPDPAAATVEPWKPAGVSSAQFESHPAFDPVTGDFWFVRSSPSFEGWRIFATRCGAGGWSKPEPWPLAGDGLEADPWFTADGKTLWFISSRSTDGVKRKDLDIWRVERDVSGKWGAPVRLPEPVNSTGPEWFPRPSPDGWLYFGSSRPGGLGKNDIWRARETGGKWVVENLGPAVNTAGDEYEPLPSADGTRLIVMTTEGFFESRWKDGRWSPRTKLPPEVHAGGMVIGAVFSPSGRSLLFARDTGPPDSGEFFVLREYGSEDWPPDCPAKPRP